MPRCPYCTSVVPAGPHDFRTFLRRLTTADRERLLRDAAAVTRSAPAPRAPLGRLVVDAEGSSKVVREDGDADGR